MKRYALRSILSCLIAISASPALWAQIQNVFPMIGITRGQTLQLNLVAFPGGACNPVFVFWDSNAHIIAQYQPPTLSAGQSASFSLSGATAASAADQRVEVLPQVAIANNPPGAPPCVASATAELIDNFLNLTSVIVPGVEQYPPDPAFGMVGVTSLETVRLNVSAFPFLAPCVASVGFADANGNSVGSALNVILSAGQAAFLDLPGSTLVSVFGQRAEVHPVVTLDPNLPENICLASAEVYLNATRATVVYLPPAPL